LQRIALEGKIRALEETQEELVETKKQLALGQVIVGLAHELNTPLGNAITSSSHIADLLAQEDLPLVPFPQSPLHKTLCEASQNLSTALKRAAELVNSFKGISDTYKREECQDFSLAEMVDVVVYDLKQEKILEKDPFLEIDKELVVCTHKEALQKVISQLLSNAYTFGMGQKRQAVIRSFRDHRDLVIEVEDRGGGFSPEELEKLYDPFYTTARAKGHLGLGLFISQNLVTHVLEGKLGINNNALGGVTARLALYGVCL